MNLQLAILMDLSKAFDCLPHNILISKLSAYGLSENSTCMMNSYLSGRKQQIKIGDIVSTWANLKKGVPQVSILGPLLFNVFINDIFYFIKKGTLYNYADDNTLSFNSPNFDELTNVLESESKVLIEWFDFNCMQANPDKFQAIAVGKKTADRSPAFNIGEVTISCDEVVKLLGVDIDLQFNLIITSLKHFKKSSHSNSNILKRIGKDLYKT